MTTVRLAWHQLRLEQRAFWRSREKAFFTFAVPVLLLVLVGATSHRPPGHSGPRPAVLLVPGFMAFGVITAAYGNLSATIALLRSEGVLKRIRSTPLPPGAYIAAHLGSAVITSVLISVACVALGAAVFAVTPLASSALALFGVLVLGVVCFASLGIALTGLIRRADSAAVVASATYIPLAIISGTFSYDLTLPGWVARVAGLLPIKAFTDALRDCYNPTAPGGLTGSLAVLAVWSVVGVLVSRRLFRWNP